MNPYRFHLLNRNLIASGDAVAVVSIAYAVDDEEEGEMYRVVAVAGILTDWDQLPSLIYSFGISEGLTEDSLLSGFDELGIRQTVNSTEYTDNDYHVAPVPDAGPVTDLVVQFTLRLDRVNHMEWPSLEVEIVTVGVF